MQQKSSFRVRIRWFLLLTLASILQGCAISPPQRQPANATLPALFLPPTQIAVMTPTSPAPVVSPETTPTLPCSDALTYISDLTIPDGSIIQPGASIDKRWEVENSGSCSWESGYTLRLIAGDELSAGNQLTLVPARSGTRAVIRILFQAPQESGNYRSAWQAYNRNDLPFGDPIFMDIVVQP